MTQRDGVVTEHQLRREHVNQAEQRDHTGDEARERERDHGRATGGERFHRVDRGASDRDKHDTTFGVNYEATQRDLWKTYRLTGGVAR